MEKFNLRDKVYISGAPDEDGDICLTAASSTIFMTRKEMRQMRDHLDALLKEEKMPGISVGSEVRIIITNHKDLIGETGTVEHVFESGNLQVNVGNETVVVAPNWVEVVK